ncbi:MAG: hypothetical protein OHK0029_12590 [Armatimonadaceae bacterium]
MCGLVPNRLSLGRKWGASALGTLVSAVGLLAGPVSSAYAQRDLTVGGDARIFAMGGAGLALLNPLGGAGSRMNPATLAFEPKNLAFQYPSLALRTDGGVSLGRVSNYLLGGQDFDDASDIIRETLDSDSVIGANGGIGLRYSRFEIGAQVVARGQVRPNEALRQWAANGGDFPTDARSDIYAAGYYTAPTVTAGFYIPDPNGNRYAYGVGVRAKVVTAVYTHYIADADAITGQGALARAPEMNGRDSLTRQGVAVDLGFSMQPLRGQRDISAALVIANALRSNFSFDGTDPNGTPERFNVLATTVNSGVGYRDGKLTLAADWTDMTSSAGPTQLRLGGEYRFDQRFQVRGGYNSTNGFTWGLGFFGLDIAFGRNQPLEAVTTIGF